ncbi:DUF883 domain-containing protein [Pseudomonas sp. JM0905a]|jgi:ElaB/YqjD/DUF883 family membrane-anchored ribosome-binding protein|uniref:DUF883 family protein n=1 Tax=unclassified Pseudomonas TaxID=196821 RepID=UPI00168A1B43|nr:MULTISPECIES: YqjD family protein [unclassified Pseudomonas]MBD2836650.1 DUF883 domain-containing protein [Pseudomonas sp. JM0905a]MDH4561084.1 DUF883 domain-containing protein [Pseudomonas sp. BN411]
MPRKTAARAQDDLLADFQTLVSDTEKLLQDTASLAGEQADELRLQIHESLKRARDTLRDTEQNLKERGQAAVQATEDYVQEHPWQSVGLAAGIGFLLGLLAARR